MNKLKLGLTALAGTLATLSAAEAGGVKVSGTMEMSYVNLDSAANTGTKLGQKKNISFSGSGEFSNGWTYGILHVQNDSMSGMSSSSMNINMGGIMTIAYDSGTGGYGANSVDNVVPTAWEEIDYGFSTGITDVGTVSKSHGVVNLTLKAPGSGTAISYSYVARTGGKANADGATSEGTGQHGHDMYIDLWNIDGGWFGIRTGGAAEKVEHGITCKNSFKVQDRIESCEGQGEDGYAGSLYQTLRLGPLSAGFQATYKDDGNAAINGVASNTSWVAGAAFTVGKYLSFSYGKGYDEYHYNSHVNGKRAKGDDGWQDKTHATYSGYSAAMNWGPLALKGVRNTVQNQGGASTNGQTHQEINLSMAF